MWWAPIFSPCKMRDCHMPLCAWPQHPGVITPARTRSLQGDVAAQLTRVAATPARGQDDRFKLADQALAMYDRLLKKRRALGPEAHDDEIGRASCRERVCQYV